MKENDKKENNDENKNVPDKEIISESDTEKLVKLVDRNAEIIKKHKKSDEVLS